MATPRAKVVSEYGYENEYEDGDDEDRDRGRRGVLRRNSDPTVSLGVRGRKSRSRSHSRGQESSDAIKINIHGTRTLVYPPRAGYRETTRKPTEDIVMDWVCVFY